MCASLLDARGVDAASLDLVERRVRDAVAKIAARRGVEATRHAAARRRSRSRSTASSSLEALLAARRRGIAAEPTWSGAGHDVQHIAALVPSLLLFVPLRGGESHTPFRRTRTWPTSRPPVLVARDVMAARGR